MSNCLHLLLCSYDGLVSLGLKHKDGFEGAEVLSVLSSVGETLRCSHHVALTTAHLDRTWGEEYFRRPLNKSIYKFMLSDKDDTKDEIHVVTFLSTLQPDATGEQTCVRCFCFTPRL